MEELYLQLQGHFRFQIDGIISDLSRIVAGRGGISLPSFSQFLHMLHLLFVLVLLILS